MKITDGKRTVEITMHTFDGASLSPDWSSDFFEAGGLPVDNEAEAYMVESVDYCVSMAEEIFLRTKKSSLIRAWFSSRMYEAVRSKPRV